MASRVLVSVFASFLVLGFFGAIIPAGPAFAATPYEYSDRHEGDPGDGVLDPAVDAGSGGRSGGKTPDRVSTATQDPTIAGQLQSSFGFALRPVYLPGPGLGTLVFLPTSWGPATSYLAGDGRWQNAP